MNATRRLALVAVGATLLAGERIARACDLHISLGGVPAPAAKPADRGNTVSAEPLSSTPFTRAVLVPLSLDRSTFRPSMHGEGLLESKPNPFAVGGTRFGHEFTGWIDSRHPALNQGSGTFLGYDRYDRRFDIASTNLIDNTGVSSFGETGRDFSHANRVWASQAGVSVIERENRTIMSPAVGQPGSFDFPLSFAEEEALMSASNVGGGTRIDNYYAKNLSSGAYGETYNPSLRPAAGNNDGLFIAETVATTGGGTIPITRNTFAHEFTHFVTDGEGIHMQNAGADAAHSGDRRNVIGNPQFDPGQQGTALGNIPDNDEVAGPAVSTGNGMPGGVPKVGGISQVKRSQVFTTAKGAFGDAQVAPYRTATVNNTAGNRVDWNFVADDWITEDLGGGADAFPGGRESLFFAPGTPAAGADPAPTPDNGGKSKDPLGIFNNPGAYSGTFLFVDVFSLIARYADYDVNDQGDASLRASALDYDLHFVLQDNSIVPGVVTDVFTEGWSNLAFADDWLARWQSPAPAIGVLITAHQYRDLVTNELIGNVQIDAVIASNIPEPGTALLLLAGALAMRRRRSI